MVTIQKLWIATYIRQEFKQMPSYYEAVGEEPTYELAESSYLIQHVG